MSGPGRGMAGTIRVVTVDGEEKICYSGYVLQMKKK